MGVEFVKDERDKRPSEALPVPERAGFVRRFVRFRGYDADGHQSRMRELGYRNVERTGTAVPDADPRLTSAQHAQIDNTIKRGDTILMECPVERVEARQREQQDLTRRRTQAATAQVPQDTGRGRRRRE